MQGLISPIGKFVSNFRVSRSCICFYTFDLTVFLIKLHLSVIELDSSVRKASEGVEFCGVSYWRNNHGSE